MPAPVLVAPVVAIPGVRLEPFRLVSSGRGCPACGDSVCFDPADCLHQLTSRSWGDCDWCEGSGWADEGAGSLWCDGCDGSGLEYGPGVCLTVNANAAARLASRIDALRALVGVAA